MSEPASKIFIDSDDLGESVLSVICLQNFDCHHSERKGAFCRQFKNFPVLFSDLCCMLLLFHARQWHIRTACIHFEVYSYQPIFKASGPCFQLIYVWHIDTITKRNFMTVLNILSTRPFYHANSNSQCDRCSCTLALHGWASTESFDLADWSQVWFS